MTKYVFGQSEIAAWQEALTTRLPSLITDEEFPDMPQVDGVIAIAHTAGIGFRMLTRDGREIEFLLNPVAARAIASTVITQGQEHGWLNEKGEVTTPLRPIDH